MVRIDGADLGDKPPVQRLQPGVQISDVVIGGDGLVQQIVAEDRRFIPVAFGDRAPDGNGPILEAGHVEEEREARSVVVIDAGLAAGGCMQIEDDVKPGRLTPRDELVEQRPPFGVCRTFEQGVVQRHAHRVEAEAGNQVDVFPLNEGLAEASPESLGLRAAEEPLRGGIDGAGRLCHFEVEHVAFRHQPVAQIDALEDQRPPVGGDKPAAAGMGEAVRRTFGRVGRCGGVVRRCRQHRTQKCGHY